MSVYTIHYYPVDCAKSYVRDKKLPVVDKVFSVARESSGEGGFWSVGLRVYKWNYIFIVKYTVKFPFLDVNRKEDLYLTVLTEDKRAIAIVDWVDITCSSVFILPSYFLHKNIEELIRRGWLLYLSHEDEIMKKKRRFGVGFSYLADVFREELEEIRRIEKKVANEGV